MADFPPMTDKAAAAFADYVDMPPGERSLEALAAKYRRRTESVPTKQLSRLKVWSAKYEWPRLIATAITENVRRKLELAAELDADTFLKTSERLHETVASPGYIHPSDVTRIRESVRKAEPKATTTVDVKHSGTVKHAHHDMSQFTDDEIDTLAEIASRQKAEVTS